MAQECSSTEGESVKLPDQPSQEELERFFAKDLFAYVQTDCRITEGWKGHGQAEMVLAEKHLNAKGYVMGGAVFTLADYAFAAATMCGSDAAVSLTSTIEFMKSSRGTKLIATCDEDRCGHKVGFYTTEVVDDLGERIAKVVTTCYHPTA